MGRGLRAQAEELARKIFREKNGCEWSERGRMEFDREFRRRSGLERDAAELLSGLRSVVNKAARLAKTHPEEQRERLLVAGPVGDLFRWLARYPDAVQELVEIGSGPGRKKRQRHDNKRSLIRELYRQVLTRPVPEIPPGIFEGVRAPTGAKPFDILALAPVPSGGVGMRTRSHRELAALGILCGVWDPKYEERNAAWTAEDVLDMETETYSEAERSRMRRRRRASRKRRRS